MLHANEWMNGNHKEWVNNSRSVNFDALNHIEREIQKHGEIQIQSVQASGDFE
jgi:hypothetical protein